MKQSRAQLSEALTDAAEAAILRDGFQSLRARSLTEAAGCALGALYTVFPDMDALILAVKARILDRLDAHLLATMARPEFAGEEAGIALLLAMADAYLAFAWDERRAWAALFQHRPAGDEGLPDWYRVRLSAIFSHVAVPLRGLCPGWPEPAASRMAQLMFSAVHGLVVLGLEQKLDRTRRGEIAVQIETLLRSMVAGLRLRPELGLGLLPPAATAGDDV